MKPSHLATIVFAGLGIGGMSTSCTAAPSPSGIALSQKQAITRSGWTNQDIYQALIRGGPAIGDAPPASWRKRNQRQIRLARRRRHAAGCKHAFN